MGQKISDYTYRLDSDCTLLKLDEQILQHCDRFDCGVDDLNDFFSNDALAYEKDLMGKTYCWLDNRNDTKIVAMVTLANASIQTSHLQNNPKRLLHKNIAHCKQGRTYPAVLIGRLGVNSAFQGPAFRIGAQIMDFIKDWFSSADNKTGCRFVLVDAINNDHTRSYYERNGFKPLFPRVSDEKDFYGIKTHEELRTRIYYFDLLSNDIPQ
ncbi:MAG: N-acetyltransferase [Bacteroidales bacterium]|nr:N-acetyltransferase [Bacteroidales bacterium]